jgi:hypothetical protein
MRRLVVAALFAGGVAHADPAGVAKRVAAEIKCDDASDLLRSWCPAARIGQADAVRLPKTPTTFVGVTIALKANASVRKAALDNLSLSALHLGTDGARLTAITPSNEEERKPILEAAMQVTAVLKGKANAIKLSSDLAGFLASQLKKPRHPLTMGAKSATWKSENPAELFQVGDVYVVIETTSDGDWVNVFPIR